MLDGVPNDSNKNLDNSAAAAQAEATVVAVGYAAGADLTMLGRIATSEVYVFGNELLETTRGELSGGQFSSIVCQ